MKFIFEVEELVDGGSVTLLNPEELFDEHGETKVVWAMSIISGVLDDNIKGYCKEHLEEMKAFFAARYIVRDRIAAEIEDLTK